MATKRAARKTGAQAKPSATRGKVGAKRPPRARSKRTARPHAETGLAALERWSETELESAEQARQASALIRDFEARPGRYTDSDSFTSAFHRIIGIFQQPTEKEAKDTLRAEALPALLRLHDARLREWRKTSPQQGHDPTASDLLFALKIFAMYRGKEAVQRIIDAARLPLHPEGYLWSAILSTLVEHDVPEARRVASALRAPLPPGYLAVALLDAANTLANEHGVKPHPFDTPRGRERLRAFLVDKNPDHFSHAHSAAASLPFISDSGALLALAERHPDINVRMEAAWAAARLGDGGALERLQAWLKSPRTRSRAVAYLKDLGSRPPPVQAPQVPPRFVMSKRARACGPRNPSKPGERWAISK